MADILFRAHGKINSAIGAAAFEIIDGAEPEAILHIMGIAVTSALEEAKKEIEGLG